MDIVNESIGLYNGVSQQDVVLRLPTQVEESINCYHSLDLGLRRRNPTNLISNATGVTDNSWVYSYDRGSAGDLTEKYSVVITEDGLKVLDLETGLEMTLQDTSGTYLEPFSITGYSAITVKDTTFITNRNKVVEMIKNTSSIDLSQVAYIWIKRADPIDGFVYNVTVNGTTVTSTGVKTTTGVASDLKTKIDALANVSAVYSGNIIKITGTITSIMTSDNTGDTAIGYIWKLVPTENDLPSSMPYDATIQVGGLNKSDAKYWLKVSDGRWIETRDPNIDYKLDNTTLPHKLTREFDISGNPYFKFEPITYSDRVVGDEETSPVPTFVGTGIVDMFFFRNRLGFVTPSTLVFSEDGYYYNFWRTSQVTTLDSDRIDISVDTKKAIKLHYVEFLQDDMIIFGDRSQFKISYDGVLSSKTISASIVSEYDMNVKVRPLSIDDRIFFVANNGSNTTVFTYFKDAYDELNRAENITVQIPRYIDNDIAQIVGSSVNSVIFFRSNTQTNVLYVYKYYIDNRKLIQSAWSKWTFDGDIHSIFTSESKLYIIMDRFNQPTDDDWLFKVGVWNDEYLWEDDLPILDEPTTSTSNLEYMFITPQDIGDVFLDIGEVNYSSDVTLSRYIPKQQDVSRLSDKVIVKTIDIKSANGSKFDLSISNKGNSRIVDKKYSANRRLYVGGKPEDNEVKIMSNNSYGFEINGLAIEARINNRSQRI